MTKWTLSRRIMLICMGLGMLTVIQGFLSLNSMYRTKQALQQAALARRADGDLLATVDRAGGDDLTGAAMKSVTSGIPQVWAILVITVILGSSGAFWFSRMVNRSIKPLEAAIQSLGKGVLSGSVEIHSTDDIGFMASYMNNALEQMTCTVSGIDFCNEKITSATNEIHSRTSQAAKAAITQRNRIREIGDSMQEMVESFHQVSDDSTRAASSASDTIEIARKGGEIVHNALVNMETIADSVKASAQKVEALGRSSDQIGRIVAVINEIAEQTNLLALNAAIEAARAGDQGRGFAVVAGEVRRLAERTGAATKEIAQMIQTVQSETRAAVDQMKTGTAQVELGVATTSQAGSSLEEIISAAQQVGGMISRISEAASHQGGSAKQINNNLEQIARLTSESAEHIQESTNSCQNLDQLTKSMKTIIGQFQFRQIISGESET